MFKLPDISTAITADLSPLKMAFGKAGEMAGESSGGIGEAFKSVGEFLAEPASKLLEMGSEALSLGEAMRHVSEAMRGIDEAAKASDKIGITTQAFEALSLQAKLTGVDMSAVEMGIKEMQKSLVDAANGAGDAATTFAGLNLNVDELVNLPADQAIGKIGDALNAITNPAERAKAQMEVFGMRSGPELANLLHQGSEGLEKARQDIDEMGGAFSRVDAARIEEANEAFIKLHEGISIVADKIAVALSPFVQALGDHLVDAAKQANGFGTQIAGGIELATQSLAKMADTLSLVKAGFEGVWIVAMQGAERTAKLFGRDTEEMQQGIADAVKQMGIDLGKFTSGANSAAVTKAFQERMKKSAEGAQAIADNAQQMGGAFAGIGDGAADAAKKISESMDSLQHDIQSFGLGDEDKKLMDFKALNPSADQVERYKDMLDKIGELKEGAKIDDAIGKFRQSLEGPADHLNDTIDELNNWLDDGRISMAEFDKGMREAVEKADKETSRDSSPSRKQDQFASFISAGSNEAAKLQSELRRGVNNDVPSKQLATAQRQEKLLQDIRQRLGFTVK